MQEFFENNGHINDRGISFCVDILNSDPQGELPVELSSHVQECIECKKAILQLFALMKQTKVEVDEETPQYGKEARSPELRRFPGYRVAAMTAFFIMMGIFLWYILQSPRVEEIDIDVYAENFEPLPIYESMVAQDFRSFRLEVISPEIDAEIRQGVLFRWDIQYDDPLMVTILNNRGEIIHEKTVSANEYYFDNLSEAGLYYWRLETEERLLYVGKFTFR
jgi:hypothetical protein